MIYKKMMQGIGISFVTTQPFTVPEGKILRQARADQEDSGLRNWKIAAHHFVKGTSLLQLASASSSDITLILS
jgi:hypothetical protein